MTRVAAVDCGTNSIRLLVADVEPGRPLVDVDRRLQLVRLGQGVDATGEFHPDALARTFAAVDEFAEVIERFGAERVRFVATSASRDARNRDEFFEGIQRRLGVPAEVISGDEEAELSFRGALAGVPVSDEPVLVADIGGGSTELVLGRADGTILAAESLNIGSVRLRERFLHGDPPSEAELMQARSFIRETLEKSHVPLREARTWIGVAGTVTSMVAIHLNLAEYSRQRVHRARLTRQEVCDLADSLAKAPVSELCTIPTLKPKRAEIVGAGALIAAELAGRVPSETLTVSESDILDGLALALSDPLTG